MSLVNRETGELVVLLSGDEARDLTERIRSTVEQVWSLLLEAHERQAWKALGYPTWAEYVQAEFAMSKRHANRLVVQGEVIRAIEAEVGPVGPTPAVTEREARDIKPQLSEVTKTIRERVSAGAKPADAVRTTVTEVRSPAPAPVPARTEPESPTVADVVTVVPWSFRKEVTDLEPRAARDATSYFDTKVIKNDGLWHRHLDAMPARLRPAAAEEAAQQVAHWQEAVQRLTRSTRPRSAS